MLPAIAIGFPLFCFYTRLLRADILEQMQGQDYVTTARAKGIGPWRVLTRHAFRNSLFGLLTIVGLNLGTLIGATVIIEQIFALPGIGRELLQAISNRNIPVIEGIVLVFAVVVVVANLITDLLYAVLDPRVRHGPAPEPPAPSSSPAPPPSRARRRSQLDGVARAPIPIAIIVLWSSSASSGRRSGLPAPIGGDILDRTCRCSRRATCSAPTRSATTSCPGCCTAVRRRWRSRSP